MRAPAWSLETGLQEQVSNHLKLLSSRAMVVSVEEKAGRDPVIVRMRYHQPTVDYVARRTANGRTKRDIIRCLKRFLAQRVMTDFRARENVTQSRTLS